MHFNIICCRKCSIGASSAETPTLSPNANSRAEHTPMALISPEMIRPFLKAQPRKSTNRGRRKGHTQILTDTPVKAQLESDQLQRCARKASKAMQKRSMATKRVTAKGLFSSQTSGSVGKKKLKLMPEPTAIDGESGPEANRSESKQKARQKKVQRRQEIPEIKAEKNRAYSRDQ